MDPVKLVKVKFLRVTDAPEGYFAIGAETELPEARAKQLAGGKKPALQILTKEK